MFCALDTPEAKKAGHKVAFAKDMKVLCDQGRLQYLGRMKRKSGREARCYRKPKRARA
mgnify:CR=1 FL=1